jgi:hypothetical protein
MCVCLCILYESMCVCMSTWMDGSIYMYTVSHVIRADRDYSKVPMHIYVCEYVYLFVCLFVCECVCMCVCVFYVSVYVFLCMYVCMYACMYVCMYGCMCIYIYIHEQKKILCSFSSLMLFWFV